MVLHIRKVLKIRVRRVLGFVKDRGAIEHVRLRADRRVAALQMRVICATGHDEQPPSKELVIQVLQAGTGSRLRVSQSLSLIMQRLSKTRSWVVALKCLTLLHNALQQGGFMYQDQIQLSLGKHYLNLSQFRDRSSALAWQASSWIRWYAGFLESLIAAASSSATGRFSSLQNDAIVAGILSLHILLHEISCCPTLIDVAVSHDLIKDAFRLVAKDCAPKQVELHMHMREISQRLNGLTNLQLRELVRVCEALVCEREALMRITELAVSMNLLYPNACLESTLFAGYELMHLKAASEAAWRASSTDLNKASVTKDVLSGSFKVLRLSPLKTLKDHTTAARQGQRSENYFR